MPVPSPFGVPDGTPFDEYEADQIRRWVDTLPSNEENAVPQTQSTISKTMDCAIATAIKRIEKAVRAGIVGQLTGKPSRYWQIGGEPTSATSCSDDEPIEEAGSNEQPTPPADEPDPYPADGSEPDTEESEATDGATQDDEESEEMPDEPASSADEVREAVRHLEEASEVLGIPDFNPDVTEPGDPTEETAKVGSPEPVRVEMVLDYVPGAEIREANLLRTAESNATGREIAEAIEAETVVVSGVPRLMVEILSKALQHVASTGILPPVPTGDRAADKLAHYQWVVFLVAQLSDQLVNGRPARDLDGKIIELRRISEILDDL